MASHWKPAPPSRSAMTFWQAASSGVTDLREMSSFASSSTLPSGIRVDLEVVERRALAGLHTLVVRRLHRLRHRGRRTAGARQAELARSSLVDQPQHVGRGVGVRHRLLLGDLAFHEELEERLLEGLRAWRETLLERVLNLADVTPLDELRDIARVEQH